MPRRSASIGTFDSQVSPWTAWANQPRAKDRFLITEDSEMTLKAIAKSEGTKGKAPTRVPKTLMRVFGTRATTQRET
jgi:hypothetical protein